MNPSVCRYCGKVYHSTSGLHDESAHKGKAPCTCCGRQFYSRANLTRHSCSTHEAALTHKCDCGCQKSFATNADLQRHRRRPSSKLICEICNAKFTDQTMLKDHLDKHTGMKKYGIRANAVHPGFVNSEIFTPMKKGVPAWVYKLFRIFSSYFAVDCRGGAQTTIFVAVDESAQYCSGEYFSGCQRWYMHPFAKDEKACKQLWEDSMKVCGLS